VTASKSDRSYAFQEDQDAPAEQHLLSRLRSPRTLSSDRVAGWDISLVLRIRAFDKYSLTIERLRFH